MPLIPRKVKLPPRAAIEIGNEMGYAPRHVRYVARRERPGSEPLIARIQQAGASRPKQKKS